LFAAKGKSAEICSPVDRMNCGLLGQQPINRHPVLLIPQLFCNPPTPAPMLSYPPSRRRLNINWI